MSAFTLDTSGYVQCLAPDQKPNESTGCWFWSDLTPFAQGYVEAMLSEWHEALISAAIAARCTTVLPQFRHFSHEALAMIRADCERAYRGDYVGGDGRVFWRSRQRGICEGYPPLAPTLGDDGKIYLRVAS